MNLDMDILNSQYIMSPEGHEHIVTKKEKTTDKTKTMTQINTKDTFN